MTETAPDTEMFIYERSARRGFQYWAMLCVGAMFLYAGATIEPSTNCSSDGECAPWLVPVAWLMGAAITAMALGYLWANPNRGSRIDAGTGDLIWWQNRIGKTGGDEGRIAPADISRILIVRQSESDDDVHLYNRGGERQAYFDAEVISWPYEKWAERLAYRWPHIIVEVRD